MGTQVVHAVKYDRKQIPFDLDDAYAFRKDRKFRWLQKACFWILKKIGAYKIDYTVSYERVVIDPNRFMRNICEQRRNLLYMFDRDVKRILIGEQQYHEIMGDREVRELLQFDVSIDRRRMDEYGRTVGFVQNIRVEVIPWMDGILALDH